MEQLKGAPAHPIATLPTNARTRLIAITGQPGAGVSTTARLLTSRFDAFPMSLAAYPRMRMAAEEGMKGMGPTAEQALCAFRTEGEAQDPLMWIRPFHRRLARVLRRSRPGRMVLTGVLTRRELWYCHALGARLIHLTAPPAVRRQRIGLRFPTEPVPAYETLERVSHADPRIWDRIVDTDEPYGEFIHHMRLLIDRL